MQEEKIIRNHPLFEFYIENNHIIINNADYFKDNCVINLKDVFVIEVIKNLSFFNKIIEATFGFWQDSKSDVLRIKLKNGFKDILLTNCDIKKTESIVYKINELILKQVNKT
jgi:hypothetical protein